MHSASISLSRRLRLGSVLVLALMAFAIAPAQAQTFNVIYNFTGSTDGAGPLNGLVMDSQGNLYGTTSANGQYNYGNVFMMTTAGVETVLHAFQGGNDGGNPNGLLLRDKSGNLYGTTTTGGFSNAGTVFEITSAGVESVLYNFKGGTDGADPQAGLVIDGSGNLYGTTYSGGANGNGTVFKLSLAKTGKWMERILYSFGTSPDGANPVAAVILGSSGKLFGTASAGGEYGLGTIFELTLSGTTWTETILHNFEDEDDGAVPYAGLIAGKSGSFYGAATEGGSNGGGVIYELSPASGGGFTFNVLYSIPGWGISGAFRDLVLDGKGNLYGTTHCDGANSAGTVYELSPSASGSWTYNLLYTFTGGTDGEFVFSNLVIDQGNLYGTTNQGGANNFGDVFEVTP